MSEIELEDIFSVEKSLLNRIENPTEEDLKFIQEKFSEIPVNAPQHMVLAALVDIHKRQNIIADRDARYKLVVNFHEKTFEKERPSTKTIISEGEDALEIARITVINSLPQARIENGVLLFASAETKFSLVKIYEDVQNAVTIASPIAEANQAVNQAQSELLSEESKSLIKSLLPDKRTILGKSFLTASMGLGSILMMMPRQPSDYGKKAEVIVGAVPLYSVQRIERAKSDRKVKYRAIGDVFLAHQQGTQDSLRVDGTLYGPFRYYYLWMLIWLQESGEAITKNITLSNLDSGGLLQSTKSIDEATNTGSSKLLNYEVHRTFPIITDFSIMLNMYLQTIEWHREVIGGQEIIKYHLLFRKWIAPTSYKPFEPRYVNGVNVAAGKYKFEYYKTKTRAWIEYGIDLAYKLNQMGKEIYFRMAIGIDDKSAKDLDQESINGYNMNIQSSVKSYTGKVLGLV